MERRWRRRLYVIKPDKIQLRPITQQWASLAVICLSILQAPRSTPSAGITPLMPKLNRGFESGGCGQECWRLTLAETDAFADGMSAPQHQAEYPRSVELVYEAMEETTDGLAQVRSP